MASYSPDVLQSVFVTGLKNVHGVEHQALSLIDRQLDHLENYPEVADMLRRHRVETEQQIERVDTILQGFGETPSSLKDAVLSFTGNMAALAHLPAPDEILKNSFANQAFENFEMAAYTSLIAMAEAGFFPREELMTLRKLGSPLEGHPNMNRLPGIEASRARTPRAAVSASTVSLATT